MKICFLTKIGKPYCKEAIAVTKKLTNDVDVFRGNRDDSFPPKVIDEKYDIIISYISPWIVPKSVLDKTIKWNINFHPGPPEYPGIGCFNFAIFDAAEQFGVTAHVMNPNVDSGMIVGTKRFKMKLDETVETLSMKTYESLYCLYKDFINYIATNDSLPKSNEIWKRKPFTRRELEDLSTINIGMSKQEIDRRIRATYYSGKPSPFLVLCGYKFEYNPER